ncbi:MAG: sigma-54-dependent Fis family transcriptional regulator [Oleiphilaceae bacterium]|nr:sigma-54-dependent Fis family transcriptional regulator [Oleiphilaceae bacterium]
MSMSLPANQRRTEARKVYFQQGVLPTGLIDDAILNSWQRCSASSKPANGKAEFNVITKSSLIDLVDMNGSLIDAASVPLEQLSKTVNGAGYAVLLTDFNGHALAGYRNDRWDCKSMDGAFRQGANLSELSVGTTAMSCAVSERRPVTVSGVEHYLNANRVFNCAAAPIFDPAGRVLGAVDITRENLLVPGCALSLVHQCVKTIERRLMESLEPFITFSLEWALGGADGSADMLVALDEYGQIMGMSSKVREVTGIPQSNNPIFFQDLFDLKFEDVMDGLRGDGPAQFVTMYSGLSFFLQPVNGSYGGRSARKTPGRAHVQGSQPESKSVDFGDPDINQQAQVLVKAMDRGLPVLVQGETGTGKEVMATSLHQRSANRAGNFVAINCAAIPETLIEGELFGHTEGAYTGAKRGGSPGKIEQAHKGTLFLDEIGDMPLALQSRMLRVLESREITRLGGQTAKRVDFQLICATHRNLSEAVQTGQFREDLLYRIKGMTIKLPRLQERPGLREFIQTLCQKIAVEERFLSEAAVRVLLGHEWPGNVRELIYVLTHADVVAAPGEFIEPHHLPSDITKSALAHEPGADLENPNALKALESAAIERALECDGGDVTAAAKRLGISRATLYRRLKAKKQRPICQ